MKITLITVCFNSAAHIASVLRSVDSQTWPELEHLIIDGGSLDGTLRIIEAHPQPWRRVVSEPDNGIYDAMNKGLGLASGDVVGFINSDDFYASTGVIARVANVFSDPTIDACYGDLCYVKRDDTRTVVRYWQSSAFSPGLFEHGWCPPHPTLFVRRRVFERFGAFDLRFKIAADTELMARFLEVHRIKARYLPHVLVIMRMGGTTNRSWSNILLQNREIWRALKDHGLRPSLIGFVTRKLWSRGRQFVNRPA